MYPPAGSSYYGWYVYDYNRSAAEEGGWRCDRAHASCVVESYDALDLAICGLSVVFLLVVCVNALHLLMYGDAGQKKLERARQAEIDELVSSSVQPWTSRMSDSECNICLEPFERQSPDEMERGRTAAGTGTCLKLPCGHYYHPACIERWLRHTTNRPPRCPTCKQCALLSDFDRPLHHERIRASSAPLVPRPSVSHRAPPPLPFIA